VKELEGHGVNAPQQLISFKCYCPVSTHGVAYTWERAARWSTQLC